MTTTKSLTDSQIATLRRESAAAGDLLMTVICDVALGQRAADISDYAWTYESSEDRRWVYGMRRDEALANIASAINDCEARS